MDVPPSPGVIVGRPLLWVSTEDAEFTTEAFENSVSGLLLISTPYLSCGSDIEDAPDPAACARMSILLINSCALVTTGVSAKNERPLIRLARYVTLSSNSTTRTSDALLRVLPGKSLTNVFRCDPRSSP